MQRIEWQDIQLDLAARHLLHVAMDLLHDLEDWVADRDQADRFAAQASAPAGGSRMTVIPPRNVAKSHRSAGDGGGFFRRHVYPLVRLCGPFGSSTPDAPQPSALSSTFGRPPRGDRLSSTAFPAAGVAGFLLPFGLTVQSPPLLLPLDRKGL